MKTNKKGKYEITKYYHKADWKYLGYESRSHAAEYLDGIHTFISISLCKADMCEKCDSNLDFESSKCIHNCPMPNIDIEFGWHIDGFITEIDDKYRHYKETGNFDSYIGSKIASYANSMQKFVEKKYLTPTEFVKLLKKEGFEEIP